MPTPSRRSSGSTQLANRPKLVPQRKATTITRPPHDGSFLRGALVSIDAVKSRKKRTVPFQYNPAQLSRNVSPNVYVGSQDGSQRFTDTPKQTIQLDIQLEATFTNYLGRSPAPSVSSESFVGLLPQLDALELLISPPSKELKKYDKQIESGKLYAVPPVPPRTLFVWGPQRVLPVTITSMSITEEMFDYRLIPVRAKVQLQLEVLSFFGAPQSKDRSLVLSTIKRQEGRASKAMLFGASGKEPTGVAVK
ncbi:MAG: hypothetical protein AAGE94_17020 [Acidobacteriota bacterium]